MSTAREALARSVHMDRLPDRDFDDEMWADDQAAAYATADAGLDGLRAAGFVVLPVADAEMAWEACLAAAINLRKAGQPGLADMRTDVATRIKEAIRGS